MPYAKGSAQLCGAFCIYKKWIPVFFMYCLLTFRIEGSIFHFETKMLQVLPVCNFVFISFILLMGLCIAE